MTIPKSICVGGHTITIHFQSGLVSYNQAYGLFDPTNLKILIDADVNSSVQNETFWHEVVEALNFFTEAEMDHNKIQTFGVLLHQIANSMEVGDEGETKKRRK
tara:strand:+ start:2819 stop:3127 length:309 start_codon:yes stop_codon:yes gene_type:complete